MPPPRSRIQAPQRTSSSRSAKVEVTSSSVEPSFALRARTSSCSLMPLKGGEGRTHSIRSDQIRSKGSRVEVGGNKQAAQHPLGSVTSRSARRKEKRKRKKGERKKEEGEGEGANKLKKCTLFDCEWVEERRFKMSASSPSCALAHASSRAFQRSVPSCSRHPPVATRKGQSVSSNLI